MKWMICLLTTLPVFALADDMPKITVQQQSQRDVTLMSIDDISVDPTTDADTLKAKILVTGQGNLCGGELVISKFTAPVIPKDKKETEVRRLELLAIEPAGDILAHPCPNNVVLTKFEVPLTLNMTPPDVDGETNTRDFIFHVNEKEYTIEAVQDRHGWKVKVIEPMKRAPFHN
jgi:hypothetical protein